MLKVILTGIFWGSVAIFAIPTSLILISWDAAPGDSTYNLKVGLEKAILGAAPSSNLKSTLQIKYTERRFNEVQKVISTSHASESLNNFDNQLIASVNSIKEIKSVEEKSIQAQNLISTLEKVSQKIEQEEQILQPSRTIPTVTSRPLPTSPPQIVDSPGTPVPTQIPPVATPTQISNPIPVDIPGQLDDTKEKIRKAIEGLKKSQNNQNEGNHNNINTNTNNSRSRNNNNDNEDYKDNKNENKSKDNKDSKNN